MPILFFLIAGKESFFPIISKALSVCFFSVLPVHLSGDVLVLSEAVDVDGDEGRVGTQVLLQLLTFVEQPQSGAGLVQAGQLVALAEVLLEVGHQPLCEVSTAQFRVK